MAIIRPPKPRRKYQANPYPTTEASGALGAYGAMYPVKTSTGTHGASFSEANKYTNQSVSGGNFTTSPAVARPNNPLYRPVQVGATGSAAPLSYSTGPGERKIINYNGQEVRLGPNSTFTPKNTPQQGLLDQLLNALQRSSGPSGESSVRGALPGTGKGINGLASPVAAGKPNGNVGTNSNVGGVVSDVLNPVLQQIKGIFNNSYQPRGTYGQVPGSTTTSVETDAFQPKPSNFDYQQNVLDRNAQAINLMAQGQWPTNLASSDARALGIGQDLIDAGYQLVGGQFVAPSAITQPQRQPGEPKGGYGQAWQGTESYGDGLRSRDSFENYKQNYRAALGSNAKRWWIGRGGDNGPARPRRPKAQWTGSIGLVDLNTGT